MAPVQFEVRDFYKIKDRGTVLCGPAPAQWIGLPFSAIRGRMIEAAGCVTEVKGVEDNLIPGYRIKATDSLGLLV